MTPVCHNHPDRETWIRCQRCERPFCPDCLRPAAVGFQCHDCVKQGAKTVRRPTAPYGGQPSANPALTSMVLIAMNALVWIAVVATGGSDSKLNQALALLPDSANYMFPGGSVEFVRGVSDGAWWQLLTSGCLHVDLLHIGFNMVALWFLGPQLEMVLGRARFLALYLISLVTASAFVMMLSGPHTQTLGASGAIFGLLGGLLVVAWKLRANLQQLLFWIVTITDAALVAAVLVFAPRARRNLVQGAGLGLVLVAAVAAIALRVFMLT